MPTLKRPQIQSHNICLRFGLSPFVKFPDVATAFGTPISKADRMPAVGISTTVILTFFAPTRLRQGPRHARQTTGARNQPRPRLVDTVRRWRRYQRALHRRGRAGGARHERRALLHPSQDVDRPLGRSASAPAPNTSFRRCAKGAGWRGVRWGSLFGRDTPALNAY